MRKWRLNFDKCVGFGSDEVSAVTGGRNDVAARLKETINSFLTSMHCVAHSTKLVAIDATKNLVVKICLRN